MAPLYAACRLSGSYHTKQGIPVNSRSSSHSCCHDDTYFGVTNGHSGNAVARNSHTGHGKRVPGDTNTQYACAGKRQFGYTAKLSRRAGNCCAHGPWKRRPRYSKREGERGCGSDVVADAVVACWGGTGGASAPTFLESHGAAWHTCSRDVNGRSIKLFISRGRVHSWRQQLWGQLTAWSCSREAGHAVMPWLWRADINSLQALFSVWTQISRWCCA